MIDFFVNLITCTTINILLLKQLLIKYEKKQAWSFTILLFLTFTLLSASINMLQLPVLNLIVTFISYMLLKITLFNVNVAEDIGRDLIHFFILVFIDSLSFFIAGFIYSVDAFYFKSLTSSVMLLFFNTILFNVFRFSRVDKVPKYEAALFLFITIFSVVLIYIFSLDYPIKNNFHKIVIILLIMGLVLLNIIVFHYLEYINKNHNLKEMMLQEKLEKKMMNQHYQDMKKQYEETRKIIHDFKNHLYTMSIAYESGRIDIAQNIKEQFYKECDNVKMNFMTGSGILDIILNDKANKSKQLDIKFDFKMDDIDIGWIKEFDLITIIGNLLDNAIEANENSNLDDKYININIYQKNEMFILNIKNSCINKLEIKQTNIKSTKKNHTGFGIKNIKSAIKTYDGDFNIEIKNNECNTIIYLLKQSHDSL